MVLQVSRMLDFNRLQCPRCHQGILVEGFPLERPEVAAGWQFHQGCQVQFLSDLLFFNSPFPLELD